MVSKVRAKCPFCKAVFNLHEGQPLVCEHCHQPIPAAHTASSIYLYRQGSPYGIAGGFSIYINGEPYGKIGNKELLRIPLPYGSHNIHCACGFSRKCRDLIVSVTPENNVAYTKVYIKPGFWANSFVIEPLDPRLIGI